MPQLQIDRKCFTIKLYLLSTFDNKPYTHIWLARSHMPMLLLSLLNIRKLDTWAKIVQKVDIYPNTKQMTAERESVHSKLWAVFSLWSSRISNQFKFPTEKRSEEEKKYISRHITKKMGIFALQPLVNGDHHFQTTKINRFLDIAFNFQPVIRNIWLKSKHHCVSIPIALDDKHKNISFGFVRHWTVCMLKRWT